MLPTPTRAHGCTPGFAGWYMAEGQSYFRVNRFGFRDQEHSLDKPPDTLRVAVLGDSFAEAIQVPLEETFWRVIQQELAQAAGAAAKEVEVLNFGISGYGTAQQLQVLRHHVWQFEPDIVVLAFFAGNDVRNNSPKLESDPVRPFFRLEDDQLVLDDSFRSHPDFLKAQSGLVQLKVAAINSSRLLQLAYRWYNRQSSASRSSRAGFEPGSDALCFVEPETGPWQEAWDVTDRLVRQLYEEVERQGAELVVATVTSPIQVHPDPAVRRRFMRELGVSDLLYPERRLQQLGRAGGFAVVALAQPMRQYAQRHQKFLHGFSNTQLGKGHWNRQGHRVAGQLIAHKILRRQMLAE